MKKPNKKRYLIAIIDEIAQEYDISVKKISHDWIVRLSKNGISKHIFGYNFEINSATSYMIANDKSAVSDLLIQNNVPTVEHSLVLNPNLHNYIEEKGNWEKITKYAKQFEYNVVCKPTSGTGGNGVYLVSSQIELESTVQKLFNKNRSICISPFYKIKNEYRLIVFNNEVQLIYAKEIPEIIGDGKSSIFELLALKFNSEELSNSIIHLVAGHELNLSDVLVENQSVKLNWKSNLGKGSKPRLIKDSLLANQLSDLAIRAVQTINISFASVDIIETEEGHMRVLEINSGVMTENFIETLPEKYSQIKAIYEKTILKMLNIQ